MPESATIQAAVDLRRDGMTFDQVGAAMHPPISGPHALRMVRHYAPAAGIDITGLEGRRAPPKAERGPMLCGVCGSDLAVGHTLWTHSGVVGQVTHRQHSTLAGRGHVVFTTDH